MVVVKNPPATAGDLRDFDSIPGSGKSPGGGHSNTLQYSCLENPHGQRSLWAIVHGVAYIFPPKMNKCPLSSQSCQYLSFVFLMIAILIGVR